MGNIVINHESVAQTSNTKKMMANDNKELIILPYESIEWVPVGEEFPGAEVALLRGDPTKGAYALYAKLPPNFTIPLHYHGNTQWGIVLSGTLVLGDEKGKEILLNAGSYVYFPKGNLHYLKAGPKGLVFYEQSDEKESTVMVDDKMKDMKMEDEKMKKMEREKNRH